MRNFWTEANIDVLKNLLACKSIRRGTARFLIMIFFSLCITTSYATGWVGAYIWGGIFEDANGNPQLEKTIRGALADGFDTIRIAIGPDAVKGYRLGASCDTVRSLACFAELLFSSAAWDDPLLKRIVITTIDFTCFDAEGGSNSGCLNKKTLVDKRAQISNEYYELYEVLSKRFKGRHVEFFITNWEGDNFIYCGSSYDFARSKSFAAKCQSTFPHEQTNAKRVSAFLLWTKYKEAAAVKFRSMHRGFALYTAPEFNTFHLFDEGCNGFCVAKTDSVIGQIKYTRRLNYCSYSSYDSQARDTLFEDILAINAACRNLIVGEFGLDMRASTPARELVLFQTFDKVRRLEINHVDIVAGVIPWHYVDAKNANTTYGMRNADASVQLLQWLGPLAPERH